LKYISGLLLTFLLFSQNAQAQSKTDIECLARNDYYEARGEPIEARIGIANVVLNRVRHRRYPNSICGVIHEIRDGACQFSWYCSHRFSHQTDVKAWRMSLTIAKMVLDKDRRIYDPTHGALYYVEKAANVAWTKGFKDYVTLGNHRFYFERKEYP
jgi:N-acetylmuramoyl-L-alanine amidase